MEREPMPRGTLFKLIAILAAVLTPVLAITRTAKSAEKATCEVKIVKFGQLASMQKAGVTYYQYLVVLRVSKPIGYAADAEIGISGGGGERDGLPLNNLSTGMNRYIDWTNTQFGADHSHHEVVNVNLRCEDYYGQDKRTDYDRAKTHLYKIGEAEPLVQPWVDGCPDWLVIDSRGSTEPAGTLSPPGEMFLNAMRVGYYIPNWGNKTFVIASLANPYPAKGSIIKYISANLPLPLAYRKSEKAGVRWLKDELGKVHRRCPATSVFLSGYSQGAEVTGDTYQSRTWASVHGAALFGDLKFNPLDSSDHGNFDHQGHPPLGHLYHGYRGSRPEFSTSRVWTFCHAHDPACQGWTQAWHVFKYHKDYDKRGEPRLAARYFLQRS